MSDTECNVDPATAYRTVGYIESSISAFNGMKNVRISKFHSLESITHYLIT